MAGIVEGCVNDNDLTLEGYVRKNYKCGSLRDILTNYFQYCRVYNLPENDKEFKNYFGKVFDLYFELKEGSRR